MSAQDTPRTDAACRSCEQTRDYANEKVIDLSRALERELAAETAKREQVERELYEAEVLLKWPNGPMGGQHHAAAGVDHHDRCDICAFLNRDAKEKDGG